MAIIRVKKKINNTSIYSDYLIRRNKQISRGLNQINNVCYQIQSIDNNPNKVDKIPGKELSTNDFTDEEKMKLFQISNININSYMPSGW